MGAYLFLLYNAFHTDGRENDSVSTVLWRLFISYFTVCATVGEFHIRGTAVFQAFNAYFTAIADSVNFMPVVCVTSLEFFEVFVFKALAPYALVHMVGLGLWVLTRYCAAAATQISTSQRLVSSAVWVIYYLYPTMVGQLLRVFHCTDPIYGHGHRGETYLHADLAVACRSADHAAATTLAAVFLLVYLVAIPGLVLWVTVQNKERLEDATFRAMYGFLFVGYDPDAAWWEVVVLARKLALVAILVFVNSKFLQSFFALFVLFVATTIHQYRRPYAEPTLNRMELFGLYALFLTQLVSIGYFWIDTEVALADEKKALWETVTTVVLILANADTALVFLGHIFVASLPTIQSWWAWVRCQGKMAPEATPMVVAAETRLPVPGLEGLLLLVGRLYAWKTRAKKKKKKKPVPHKKNARFRKAGKTVVRLNQVTK